MRTLIGFICLGIVASGCGVSEEDVAKISKTTVKDETQAGYKPVSKTRCVTNSASRVFVYTVVDYSNDDRFVSCEIADASTGYSSSNYFMSGQPGADTALCRVLYDFESDSFGLWQFTTSDGTASVVYSDTTSAHDEYLVTFGSSDCTVTNAD